MRRSDTSRGQEGVIRPVTGGAHSSEADGCSALYIVIFTALPEIYVCTYCMLALCIQILSPQWVKKVVLLPIVLTVVSPFHKGYHTFAHLLLHGIKFSL